MTQEEAKRILKIYLQAISFQYPGSIAEAIRTLCEPLPLPSNLDEAAERQEMKNSMTREDNIIVPRWFLEVVENTLRIQNNINLDKETGETCQDRNIRQSLNGIRKLLKGEELTGMERLEKLQPSFPAPNLDEGEAFDGVVRDNGMFVDFDDYGSSMMIPSNASCFNNGDEVIVQIRKKWLTPAELNRLETLRYEAGLDDGVRSEKEKQKKQFWVPTDEQRYALGMVIKHSDSNADSTKVLESLLDDLTKIANPKAAK